MLSKLKIVVLSFALFLPLRSVAVPVDIELALLVDISPSVTSDEFELQKQGYVSAFKNSVIRKIINSGEFGSIASTVIYWSGADLQQQVVPWMKISDQESAHKFADAIDATTRPYNNATAVGSAINYVVPKFDNEFEGKRLIVDISGDGVSNRGINTALSRNTALSSGINTINGIVIGNDDDVLNFYKQSVQGGVNSFTLQADNFQDFNVFIYEKIGRELLPFPVESNTTRPDNKLSEIATYRVLDGEFEKTARADSSLPTIVLTHGWQPGETFGDEFPLSNVEKAVRSRADKNSTSEFNLVTYHWKDAYTDTPLSDIPADPKLWTAIAMVGSGLALQSGLLTSAGLLEVDETKAFQIYQELNEAFAKTQSAGVSLASKLVADFGREYNKPIQFVGHSLGTAVNSYAINALHSANQEPNFEFNITQNTLLDPALAMPRFSESLFYNAMPLGSVSYVDNFFGPLSNGATGSPIPNSNPSPRGQALFKSHNKIHSEYYANLIQSDSWVSAILGDSTFKDANYVEWDTPTNFELFNAGISDGWTEVTGNVVTGYRIVDWFGNLIIDAASKTYNTLKPVAIKVANVVVDAVKRTTMFVLDTGKKLIDVTVDGIVTAYKVGEEIVTYVTSAVIDVSKGIANVVVGLGNSVLNVTTAGFTKVLGLIESSPAVAVQQVAIPDDVDLLGFDLFWENSGDGDWLTLHFNDQLLWSYLPTGDLFDQTVSASLAIPDLAGQTGNFFFTLNSQGETNAQVFLGDFRFARLKHTINSAIPEPTSVLLFLIGLTMLGLASNKKLLLDGNYRKRHCKVDHEEAGNA